MANVSLVVPLQNFTYGNAGTSDSVTKKAAITLTINTRISVTDSPEGSSIPLSGEDKKICAALLMTKVKSNFLCALVPLRTHNWKAFTKEIIIPLSSRVHANMEEKNFTNVACLIVAFIADILTLVIRVFITAAPAYFYQKSNQHPLKEFLQDKKTEFVHAKYELTWSLTVKDEKSNVEELHEIKSTFVSRIDLVSPLISGPYFIMDAEGKLICISERNGEGESRDKFCKEHKAFDCEFQYFIVDSSPFMNLPTLLKPYFTAPALTIC